MDLSAATLPDAMTVTWLSFTNVPFGPVVAVSAALLSWSWWTLGRPAGFDAVHPRADESLNR